MSGASEGHGSAPPPAAGDADSGGCSGDSGGEWRIRRPNFGIQTERPAASPVRRSPSPAYRELRRWRSTSA